MVTINSITEIGQYLRNRRTKKGLRLFDVAKGTDIDTTMLSKIERGERLPTFEQVKRIADFFGISEKTLRIQVTAKKIIKEYGLNETTLNAVKLVKEQVIPYLKKKKNEKTG
ncbi:MAG: helix-turn-helix transcriptional regulator [Cytophagales bacterium]|nr:helix-turn-helix transcriptional regulator [Cytophagales bacterium]